MTNLSGAESAIEPERKMGTSAFVSIEVCGSNLRCANNDLHRAMQRTAVKVGGVVNPTVNSSAFNNHFPIRIPQARESNARWLTSQFLHFPIKNIAGARRNCGHLEFFNRAQPFGKSAIPRLRLCCRGQKKPEHRGPLARRVEQAYSVPRAVCPAQGIGTPELGAPRRAERLFWRGCLWSGVLREPSGSPLAPNGSSNRGTSGHPHWNAEPDSNGAVR